MVRISILAVALAGAVLACGSAFAEIFKSVDEHGNVVFSQQAPKGQQSSVVSPKYSHPSAQSNVGATPAAAAAAEDGGPAKKPSAKPSPEELAVKHENCANARHEIEQFGGRRLNRMQYVNEQGERATLTPDMLQSRLDQAREEIAKNCDE